MSDESSDQRIVSSPSIDPIDTIAKEKYMDEDCAARAMIEVEDQSFFDSAEFDIYTVSRVNPIHQGVDTTQSNQVV